MRMNRNPFILRKSHLLAVGVLIFLSAGLYANSLDNLFTNWDDMMIYSNGQIRSLGWKNIGTIFTPAKGATYQPVRALSYALDYHFWKLNPVGYHITNILFYILTCIMVFLTLRLLSMHLREGKEEGSHFRVALLGSLLFAAHPVHVEAVTWLAARKEVLQGFFFFSAFYLYLKGREGEGRRVLFFLFLSLFAILLAVLSKPSAIVFPAVLLVYEIARRPKGWLGFVKRHWLFFAVSIMISIIFVGIMMKVMLDAGGVKPYRGGTFFANLLVAFQIFLYNIELLVLTVNYSAAYTIDTPDPIFSFRSFLFVLGTFLLFALSLWSLKKTRVLFFSFFFFFVTLFPYLNVIPISTVLADRYVFISSFSYAFLLGIGFDRVYQLRGKRWSEGFFKLVGTVLFLFALGGYSFMTIHQNRIWENSYTLWADAVEKSPGSNTANAMMGVVYMQMGMDGEAVKFLEKAVQLLPYDYESMNNLGIVYGRLEQPGKALKNLIAALWLNPDSDAVKINLSIHYYRQREYRKAEGILKQLISEKPRDAQLHYRLAMVCKDSGDHEGAIRELNQCLVLAPQIITPYEELGNIYLIQLKDPEKAKSYYRRGIEAVPEAASRVEQLKWMIQDLER